MEKHMKQVGEIPEHLKHDLHPHHNTHPIHEETTEQLEHELNEHHKERRMRGY